MTDRERITYKSTDGLYRLDPAKFFNVVSDLTTYITEARYRASADNSGRQATSIGFFGEGRTLQIHTEVIERPGLLKTFNLAELILSEDGKQLTFKTHAHPRVVVPSNDLEEIAKRYEPF